MKTYQVTKYGNVADMQWIDQPTPTADPGEVVIRVAATGINPVDVMIADGDFKLLLPHKPPFTGGNECAGIVTAVGDGVTRFAVGDEVFARPSEKYMGTFAEHVVIAAEDVAHKPQNLSMVDAASLPLVMLTAIQAFTEKAKVRPGSKVFIQGGTGGLGSIAIQVAKHLGAHVATTVSTPNIDLARELGADVVIDYRTENFEERISDYDVVLDTLGGEKAMRSMKVLKTGGTLVSVVGPPDAELARDLNKPALQPVMFMLSRKQRATAKRMGIHYKFLLMHADGAKLEEYRSIVESGDIKPVVGSVYEFAELPEALELAKSGKTKKTSKPKPGKIVVKM